MKRWTTAMAVGAVGVFGARSAASATTVLPGAVGGQTWTLAGSPYVVQGDVTVASGTTLTIDPGVKVLFADQDKSGGGLDAKIVELTISGSLVADGTEKQPITFMPETGTAKGSWYGIVVGANGTASLSHDSIVGAFDGVRSNSAALSFHDVQIDSSTTGVLVTSGSPALRRLTATGCTVGVSYSGSGGGKLTESLINLSTSVAVNAQVSADINLTISNTVIVGGNAGIVLKEVGVGNTMTVNIVHSSLSNGNGRGIEVSNNPGSTTSLGILNSIVTSWGNAGIELGSAGNTTNSVDLTYSDVFGNKLDFVGVTPGVGCISADPKFAVNPPLAIAEASPCKDTGTAAGANPTDILGALRPFGAGYDMGAYEYGGVVPTDPPDAGADAGPDAGPDAGVDAGHDAGDDDAGAVADGGGNPNPSDSGGVITGSSGGSSSGAPSAPVDSGLSLGAPANLGPGSGSDDDCSVHAIGASGVGGLWLLGVVGALTARRRRRS